MSRWLPCKRIVFIRKLLNLGFEGLYAGTKHHFMIYKGFRLAIPSNKEFSIPQLKMMIHEIEFIIGRKITADDWNNL